MTIFSKQQAASGMACNLRSISQESVVIYRTEIKKAEGKTLFKNVKVRRILALVLMVMMMRSLYSGSVGLTGVYADSPAGDNTGSGGGGGSGPIPGIAPFYEGLDELPDPIDPKSWTLQRDMTWDDWTANPVIDWGKEYAAGNVTPKTPRKGALVLVDFPDRPFDVTLPKESNQFTNPKIDPIAEKDLAEFWRVFLNVPDASNHYTTINSFLLENSYGDWSMELDAFGPYTMPNFEFQYGLNDGMNDRALDMPPGFATASIASDVFGAIEAAKELNYNDYAFVFVLHSGNDESGVWQEFGELKWQNKEDVPYEFGPLWKLEQLIDLGYGDKVSAEALAWAKAKNENGGNWSKTRYVDWTAWLSGTSIWSSQSSTTRTNPFTGERQSIRYSLQSEDCGMATFAHEFGHVVTLPDNYGSPYYYNRDYSGPWDVMSRGCFSGPGGDHDRWLVPGYGGGSIPTHMMLRSKMLNATPFTTVSEIVDLDYAALKEMTPVVAEIATREVPIGPEYGVSGVKGIRITNLVDQNVQSPAWNSLRCVVPQGQSGASVGSTAFTGMTVEVVDQVGYDSFLNDHGVIISRTKASGTGHCFVIDAHPEDIDIVDFVKPDGTVVNFTHGHQMQLADAAFHAGVSEGTVNEWHDVPNNLSFYILDKKMTPNKYGDVLSYDVGVLRTDGVPVGGTLEVTRGSLTPAIPGKVAVQEFKIKNTGDKTDIVRLTLGGTFDFISALHLQNNIYAIGPGEEITVPVYFDVFVNNIYFPDGDITKDTAVRYELSLTASSESNPAKSAEIGIVDFYKEAAIQTILLKLDKVYLNEGDYFNVATSLSNPLLSNVVVLDYTFDKDKIAFANYVTANGVDLISWESTENGVRLILMKQDYIMKDIVTVMFQAKETLTETSNLFKVEGRFAVRTGSEKEVVTLSNILGYFPPDDPTDKDLIYLSNVIDAFGATKKDANWNEVKKFDFDQNGSIDILDICYAASKIKI